MTIPRGRTTRIALGTAGAIVVVLVVAQFALPAIAARIARDQLAKYGTVRSVSVHAFPAIELLWGHAQSATVRAGDLHMSDSQFDGLVPRMRGIESIDMSADSLQLGPLRVRDLRTEKRGEELEVRGSLTQADLQSALPAGMQVRLVESVGDGVEVRVSGSLFGVGASVLALLRAQEGKLVAQPQGFPFAGFARITLISDPRLFVQGFGLSSESAATSGASYALTLRAKLR
jgi:LmeA-like phospholipid-binding